MIGALVALIGLAVHGALYLVLKASGELEERARRFSQRAWVALCVLTALSLIATILVRAQTLKNYQRHPASFAIPVLVVLSLAGMRILSQERQPVGAFLRSSLYLGVMLIGAAVGLYPTLLPSSKNPADNITVANALSGNYAVHAGLYWWIFGILLAVAYFVVNYRMFRGKVASEGDGYGH